MVPCEDIFGNKPCRLHLGNAELNCLCFQIFRFLLHLCSPFSQCPLKPSRSSLWRYQWRWLLFSPTPQALWVLSAGPLHCPLTWMRMRDSSTLSRCQWLFIVQLCLHLNINLVPNTVFTPDATKQPLQIHLLFVSEMAQAPKVRQFVVALHCIQCRQNH